MESVKNKIHVLNLGGLANRVNNIVNGIFLSSHLKRELHLVWPISRACNCSFNELFHNKIKTTNLPEDLLPKVADDYYQIAGENAYFYKKNWEPSFTTGDILKKFRTYQEYGQGKKLLSNINAHNHGTLLQSGVIFNFVPFNYIIDILTCIKPVDDITDRVNEFSIRNNIDKRVIGIHIRKTDNLKSNELFFIEKLKKYIGKNSAQKIFLCSDSEKTEKKYKAMYPENIIIHEKEFYPEKIKKNEPWRIEETDSKKYNVFRSKESVKLSLVDLYLLAKTNFEVRSTGTFSQLAYYLSIHKNIWHQYDEGVKRKIKYLIRNLH